MFILRKLLRLFPSIWSLRQGYELKPVYVTYSKYIKEATTLFGNFLYLFLHVNIQNTQEDKFQIYVSQNS